MQYLRARAATSCAAAAHVPSLVVGRSLLLRQAPLSRVEHDSGTASATSQRLVSCNAHKDSRGGRRYRPSEEEDEAVSDAFRINVNGTRVTIPQEQLWVLAVPAVLVLGLAAMIGPLIIGVAMAAVAVGAAMSIGAFAMSFFWVPFIMMFGFMFLTFGGFTFGAIATVGLGLFLPKIMSLMIALGGVGLGWFVVQNVLPKAKTTVSSPPPSASKQRGASSSQSQDGPVVQAEVRSLDEEEAEVRRMAAELKDFDRMMAEAEERRRVDEWRRRTTGR